MTHKKKKKKLFLLKIIAMGTECTVAHDGLTPTLRVSAYIIALHPNLGHVLGMDLCRIRHVNIHHTVKYQLSSCYGLKTGWTLKRAAFRSDGKRRKYELHHLSFYLACKLNYKQMQSRLVSKHFKHCSIYLEMLPEHPLSKKRKHEL